MEAHRMRDRFAQLVSSDEAPDTGDDSDEDLITSYLNAGSGLGGVGSSANAGDSLIPTIQVTPHSPNANRILEDNLLQLAQIQDRIQMLRMENAAAAASTTITSAHGRNELSLNGLSSCIGGDRLSTSCPSLNNSVADSPFADISQTPTTDNSTPSHHDKNRNFSSAANNEIYQQLNQRRRKDQSAGAIPGAKAVHRKRQGRQRSMSVSSGDSDEDLGVDRVDGTAANKIRQRSASNMGGVITGRSTTVPIVVTSAAAAAAANIDNRNNNNNNNNNSNNHHHHHSSGASSVYHRLIHGRSVQKSPHLLAQLPTLHKSVSTPSIVVEPSGSSAKSGQSTRRFPEPTEVFLQRLMSDHDWACRRSGTDSESEEERHASSTELGSGQAGQTGASSFTAGQYSNQFVARKLANHAAGSPQLSWAEFLQDDPTLEDDDSRKRRRKKERSSIFFRKKKDKSVTKPPSNAFYDFNVQQQQQQFHHPHHGSHGPGGASSKGLSKVSSSINLGTNVSGTGLGNLGRASISGQPSGMGGANRLTHYSHSLSSLRKPSVAGQDSNSGSGMGPNSNFYIARGELSKNYNDDRDEFGHEETSGLIEGEYVPSEEFPEGGPAAIRDLETPPFLRIQDEEPETWQQTVRPEDLISLRAVDIKRQEHMYEFIITESNHCQVLKVIQKIFVEGMQNYLNLNKDIIDRIFPCIDQLIDIHFHFLEELRIRQNEQPVMSTLADILLNQFSGESGDRWRDAYGSFCAGHIEAVSVFKDLMKSDRRFGLFVRQCSENPLLKKKGVPECILFVTTRITKYPLLIEPLIKTSKDRPSEQEQLRQSNALVRDILRDVNSKVAEKERKQRLLEIYHRVDPKSTIMFKGHKFKKSDILSSSRRLMFEGVATLQQNRGRTIQVIIVVLSDILFFLQENNQKYYFITPENKPSVIPVKTLIAREKTGGSTKSLHIISMTEKYEPEVFDLEIMQPPTREDWISGIREAVDACSPGSDSEDDMGGTDEDLRRRHVQSKYLRLRRLTAELRSKDLELAKILEDKMRIMSEMLSVVGTDDPLKGCPPDYQSLVRMKVDPADLAVSAGSIFGAMADASRGGSHASLVGASNYTKEQLLSAVQEASRLASSLYSSGNNLSRSVSSVGERHSCVYTSPVLPKRAETFGGFDIQQGGANVAGGMKKTLAAKEINIDGTESDQLSPADSYGLLADGTRAGQDEPEAAIGQEMTAMQIVASKPSSVSPLLTLDPDQQAAAVQMTHYLNSLMCMVSEHFTSLESLKAELSEIREKSTIFGGRYKHNQLLEDLRHLQETLTQEKKSWAIEKETSEQEMEAKKKELAKYQAEIDRGLKDVREQREQLYRKLDVLKAQGIELGPNMAVLKSDPPTKSAASMPAADVYFYSEVAPTNESSASSAANNNTNSLLVSSAGGSSGVRKSSSMSMTSSASASVLPQASSVATGGSLKKESLANLHLLSATNESKVASSEIKQQIPVKLSSKLSVSTTTSTGLKEKSKRVGSSSSTLTKPGSGGPSTSTISNLAKPESVQQLLPFKLSESDSGLAGLVSGSMRSGKSSPKQQPQQQQQRFQQMSSFPLVENPSGQQQWTGNSPPMVASGLRPAGNSNTLPKASGANSAGSGAAGKDVRHVQKVPYSAAGSADDPNDEDKVIYF